MSYFGDVIKQARKTKGLSLREAAKRCSVSHPYLSQLETGKNCKPSVDVINKLAKGLEIPNGNLFMAAGYISDPFDYQETSILEKLIDLNKDGKLDLYYFFECNIDVYYKDTLLTDEQREKVKIMLKTLLE